MLDFDVVMVTCSVPVFFLFSHKFLYIYFWSIFFIFSFVSSSSSSFFFSFIKFNLDSGVQSSESRVQSWLYIMPARTVT